MIAIKKITDNSQYIPDPYKKVASSMEKQFANYMINEMNKTTGEEFGKDTGSDYYKSLLTSERSKAMSENGDGLGLKKMILDQIYPQRLRSKIAYDGFNERQNSQFTKNKIEMHNKQQRFSELNKLSASIENQQGTDYE